ncbi:unnamed protein product [Clavelina lepadiformis]|uniref:Caveolin n=1 Tax=Clavelina lepadiformis TaxID=159417 RepID=A0ABP0GCI1_CLALP
MTSPENQSFSDNCLLTELRCAYQSYDDEDDEMSETGEEGEMIHLLRRETERKKEAKSFWTGDNHDTFDVEKQNLVNSKTCRKHGDLSEREKRVLSPKAHPDSTALKLGSLDSAEYPNPFLGDGLEECSPFVTNSKSTSLWSISSNCSSSPSYTLRNNLAKSKRFANMSTAEDRDSVHSLRAEKTQVTEPVISDDELVALERSISNHSGQHEDQENSKSERKTRGLTFSVQAFKSRTERDPELINQDLRVNFGDVIAEPEGYYTPKFSWNLSQEIYAFVKGCFYSIATCLLGIPAAFLWGIWFSFLACFNVWFLVPIRRSHSISMSWFKSVWSILISSICDPFYQSLGMVFNNMNVRTEKHVV